MNSSGIKAVLWMWSAIAVGVICAIMVTYAIIHYGSWVIALLGVIAAGAISYFTYKDFSE